MKRDCHNEENFENAKEPHPDDFAEKKLGMQKEKKLKGLLTFLPYPSNRKKGWPWTKETDIKLYDENRAYPKISIVTPSYNQGCFIEETIRSVLLQNYPNLEYIIIDGGSSDDTLSIIRKYQSWLSYWVSEEDRGQSHAINKGLIRCQGEILSWINSDDYYEKEAFLNLVLNIEPDIGLYIGIGHKVDLQREIKYTPEVRNVGLPYFVRWMDGNNFMQPAAFFTKQTIDKVGYLNEAYHFCMDVDLWIRIAKIFRIKKIPYTIAYAYIHEKAKTTAFVKQMRVETYLMISQHGFFELAREGLNSLIENANEPGKSIRMMNFVKSLLSRLKKILGFLGLNFR